MWVVIQYLRLAISIFFLPQMTVYQMNKIHWHVWWLIHVFVFEFFVVLKNERFHLGQSYKSRYINYFYFQKYGGIYRLLKRCFVKYHPYLHVYQPSFLWGHTGVPDIFLKSFWMPILFPLGSWPFCKVAHRSSLWSLLNHLLLLIALNGKGLI